jgi:hypothetical protein
MIVFDQELKKKEVAVFLVQRELYPSLLIIEIAFDGFVGMLDIFVRSI